MPILVELDAFSGRPNPRWALTEEQARGLLDLLLSLPAAAPPASGSPAGLGYRGFRVSGIPGEGEVVVRAGTILATPPGGLATPSGRVGARLDAARAVEALLLETARGHLAEPLFQTLSSMIAS